MVRQTLLLLLLVGLLVCATCDRRKRNLDAARKKCKMYCRTPCPAAGIAKTRCVWCRKRRLCPSGSGNIAFMQKRPERQETDGETRNNRQTPHYRQRRLTNPL